MSDSDRIFPDISEFDRATAAVELKKALAPHVATYKGVTSLDAFSAPQGGASDLYQALVPTYRPVAVPTASAATTDDAGPLFLSAEAMPLVIDDEVLRRFEVWSTTPVVIVPRRPWYVRILRMPRAWIPGTLEWRFRRWVSRKQFGVSE